LFFTTSILTGTSLYAREEIVPAKITKYYRLNYIAPKKLKVFLSKLLPGVKYEINNQLNLVLAIDTPEKIAALEKLLKDLDRQIDQVLIEAKIVEITLGSEKTYGIDWTWQDKFGGSIKEIKALLENFLSNDLTARAQLQVGTLKADSFNAVINFLLSQTNTDLLTSPSIVTLDGKKAIIIQ